MSPTGFWCSSTGCTSKIFLPSRPEAFRSATTVPLTIPRYIAGHYIPYDVEMESTDDPPTEPRVEGELDDNTSVLDGYTFGEVIGRGGIGEIQLAHDLRIGRDVAIKRLRAARPTEDEAQRFLREARIQ